MSAQGDEARRQASVLKGTGAVVTCMVCGVKGPPHMLVVIGARRGYVCSAECAKKIGGEA